MNFLGKKKRKNTGLGLHTSTGLLQGLPQPRLEGAFDTQKKPIGKKRSKGTECTKTSWFFIFFCFFFRFCLFFFKEFSVFFALTHGSYLSLAHAPKVTWLRCEDISMKRCNAHLQALAFSPRSRGAGAGEGKRKGWEKNERFSYVEKHSDWKW